MSWFLMALKKYAVFGGRSRRKEYWFFVLFSFIGAIIIGALQQVNGLMQIASLLSAVYSLGLLIPSLAAASRRLHDTGRSAWWLLLVLIPLIGGIILIIFMVFDSQPGDNKYGPNPKSDAAPAPAAPQAAPAAAPQQPPEQAPPAQQ